MDDNDKAEFIEEFKKADGPARLDMWDYALGQQVLWEGVIAELQEIARKQGVDKDLDKLIEADMKDA
jgi:hypothetical protein